MLKLYPELIEIGRSEADWAYFRKDICYAWDALDQGIINNLVRSVPRRLLATRKSKGYYTKY